MGCCFGSEEDKDFGPPQEDENRPLLRDSGQNEALSNSGSGYNAISQNTPQKGDEQSALERILHKTARNVIDVGNMNNQTVENQEYFDRTQHYITRVNNKRSKPYKQSLPNCTSAPQITLSMPPVSLADVDMVTQVAERASKAVKDVKVKHIEDLVVPFGVP